MCVLSGKAVKYLRHTKGRIINVSSMGGILPLPYQAVYSATKSGAEIFSRALANELKAYGVKVCAVLPNDTNTGFGKSLDKKVSSLETAPTEILKEGRFFVAAL